MKQKIPLIIGLFLFICFFIFLLGCTQNHNPVYPSAVVSNHFGVDGSDITAMSEIAKLGDGVTGVNGGIWGRLEPKAPLNGVPVYDSASLAKLDSVMDSVAKSARVAQMNFLFSNDWAMEYSSADTTDPVFGKKVKRFAGIKPEYLDDYKNTIKFLLKRYPQIKYLQIGSEEENAWASASGYSEALCTAYASVKETNPDVLVLAAGFNLGEFFDYSSEEQAEALATPAGSAKMAFITGVIREGKGCFDVLTIHPSGRETSIPKMLEWYNAEMLKNGYQNPIWSDDTSSGPGVGGTKPLAGEEKMFELMNEDKLRTNSEEYARLMRTQSSLLVKKSVAMFASGAERVIISCDVDFLTYFMNPWHYLGLIDGVTKTKKPAYYTYGILISKIDDFISAEKIGEDIYKFELSNGKNVFVAWSSADKNIDLSSEISGNAKLTFIITELDEKYKPVYVEGKIVSASNIPINQEPVFIEAV